ncbi:serine hydrolase [Tsuneonella mangrovi]|uniref:serine hydrolase n=1 Tax=Tsuneonella mangrovi TaxID=1982042 RepID=UPI001471677D|nr:serine hydrolase [Tsuneonella mangrovi]
MATFALGVSVLGLSPYQAVSASVAKIDREALLQTQTVPQRAWPTSVFAPPADALPPSHTIDGELTIKGEAADHYTLLHDPYDYDTNVPQTRDLPKVGVTLVSKGNEVIPVQRGPILNGDPAWDWIFEPGRAWDSASRPGMTFVALPFALMQHNSNCEHNGLALFAVGADGKATQLAYQIGSETCEYLQFDMWGLAKAQFAAKPVPEKLATLTAYANEVAARLPIRPIADLGDVAKGFGSPKEVKPEYLTTFGFVHDGVLYAGSCPTRYGPYPYCEVLDIPSYSWAKSIAGGIGLMRLEMLFPGAKDALVRDYVPECSDPKWDGVTFENLIDMTTGLFNSPGNQDDDEADSLFPFLFAETHAEHVRMACTLYPRKLAPGVRSVYHTTDTYLLGTAMTAFLKARGYKDPDYYRALVVPILKAIGVSPLLLDTRRSSDDVRMPFSGWGLVLHRNDAALLAQFYQRDGTIGGEQMLDLPMLASAMQRDPANTGLNIFDSKNWRYQHSLWAQNIGEVIGCSHDVWVPYFSGHGGLSDVMFPNGDIYFRVGDGFDYDWRPSAKAANEVGSLCN